MKINEPCPHPSIVVFDQGDKLTTQCTKCGKKMNVLRKPKCSCYGGFDCEVCNPDYYEEMKNNDTPRTDAIQFQKKPISMSIENEMLRALSRELERELAASKAEVERLTENAQRIGVNRYEVEKPKTEYWFLAADAELAIKAIER